MGERNTGHRAQVDEGGEGLGFHGGAKLWVWYLPDGIEDRETISGSVTESGAVSAG